MTLQSIPSLVWYSHGVERHADFGQGNRYLVQPGLFNKEEWDLDITSEYGKTRQFLGSFGTREKAIQAAHDHCGDV